MSLQYHGPCVTKHKLKVTEERFGEGKKETYSNSYKQLQTLY